MPNNKLFIANFKMHEPVQDYLKSFYSKLNGSKLDGSKKPKALIFTPPFTHLKDFVVQLTKHQEKDSYLASSVVASVVASVAAQDCHFAQSGAFTGDISALILQNIGVQYVIIGHSERRKHYCEDDILLKKIQAAKKCHLKIILCIGENLAQREENTYQDFLKAQLDKVLINSDLWSKEDIIAYEPCWAIGTGKIPTFNDISKTHAFLKTYSHNKFKILYGGSVNSENSGDILAINNVDGVLVGGASLDSLKFANIVNSY